MYIESKKRTLWRFLRALWPQRKESPYRTDLATCTGGCWDMMRQSIIESRALPYRAANEIRAQFEDLEPTNHRPEVITKTVTCDLQDDDASRPYPADIHVALFKPAGDSYFEERKTTIFFTMGNLETVHTMRGELQGLADETGFNVVTYEYPGYGLSEGVPTEKSIKRAGYAVFKNHFKTTVDEERTFTPTIILWGRSIGSCVAMYIAEETDLFIHGVVLSSPLASVQNNVIFRHVSALLMPFIPVISALDTFDNISIIRQGELSNVRYFVIAHGQLDPIVPIENSNCLAKEAWSRYASDERECFPQPTMFVYDDLEHNDLRSSHVIASLRESEHAILHADLDGYRPFVRTRACEGVKVAIM